MSRKIQLFCIPYAGGYAEVFAELAGLLEGAEDDTVREAGEQRERLPDAPAAVRETEEQRARLSNMSGAVQETGEAGEQWARLSDVQEAGEAGEQRARLSDVQEAGEAGEQRARLSDVQEAEETEDQQKKCRIQVIVLEYAGHGTRKKEPYYQKFEELTADITAQIQKQRDPGCPYALLGYSMGSIAVYEALADGRLDVPEHIFLAAHEAPDVEWECKGYSRLDDESFLDELLCYGGFPEKFDRALLKNRFFRRLYFEPIRRDYDLLGSYRMKKRRQFAADVTVFYAPKDIAPEAIRSWDRFAGRGIEYIELGENHFFIRTCAEKMAEVIRRRILPEGMTVNGNP